jgi:hypothetical protein
MMSISGRFRQHGKGILLAGIDRHQGPSVKIIRSYFAISNLTVRSCCHWMPISCRFPVVE